MLTSSNLIFLLFSYLIGSIPFSIIAGKLLKALENLVVEMLVHSHLEFFGKQAGIPVLLLDILKGYLAVNLVWYTSYVPLTELYINLQLTFGIAAVLGHVFPLMLVLGKVKRYLDLC